MGKAEVQQTNLRKHIFPHTSAHMLWFLFSAVQKGDKYGEFPTFQMIKDRRIILTYWTFLEMKC